MAEMIIESKKTVAFTGAGISTESGIPDFRGPEGLWKQIDPRLVTIQHFRMFPEAFWHFIIERFEIIMKAQPNKAHYALAELEKIGKLSSIITQNVDGLHFKAGSKNVIELHGNMREAICMNCRATVPMEEALKMAKRNHYLPLCKSCGGILKASVVLFNEPLPEEAIKRAIHESRTCDLMLVVGTSLQVYPAAYMPAIAKQRGAKLAIINMEPTPLDDGADVVIHAKAGEVLPVIVRIVKEKLKEHHS
ncbi:MAG: NAD-dependent protein deacetylase [Candidatus Nezhaarchaeales archaeon]